MNKATKIIVISFAAALVIALLFFITDSTKHSSVFFIAFGLSCLGVGLLELLVSVILFISGVNNHEIAKGFLLSSGILFLVSFAACSGLSGLFR